MQLFMLQNYRKEMVGRLLHEIKALQQITHLKLTRTFINVIYTKKGALAALYLIHADLINVIARKNVN